MILPFCSETHACVLYFLSQGEEEFDMPQPPHGHVLHRHMRTIREVRTLVTRVITDVYYVDGTEVERKVTEVIHFGSMWQISFSSKISLALHFHPCPPFLCR